MTFGRDLLERHAASFRSALESWLLVNPSITLSTNFVSSDRGVFPKDCCKATSNMFGWYLRERLRLDGNIDCVWGTRGTETHGWLKCGALYVGFIADQFPEEHRRVIVELPNQSTFHTAFHHHRFTRWSMRPDHQIASYAAQVSAILELAAT